VSETLYRQFTAYCVMTGKTAGDVLTEALLPYLQKHFPVNLPRVNGKPR